MTSDELSFLTETLGTAKKDYYYYKDQYAADILSMALQGPVKVADLKKSRFGRFTHKKAVSSILGAVGKNTVNGKDFAGHYHEEAVKFGVTLGSWGEYAKGGKDPWYQTSRNGWNLVLQLNFNENHLCDYFRLIRSCTDFHPFIYADHPVLKKAGFTLAWSRLDVDLENGEVLIEEIQNDWLREAKDEMQDAKVTLELAAKNKSFSDREIRKAENYIRYYEKCLKPYIRIWDEAILNLAIGFAVAELGCRKIWYHTVESGNRLKGLAEDFMPPRSLYSKLPQRFGFELTDQAPVMLKKDKKLKKKLTDKKLRWFKMAL